MSGFYIQTEVGLSVRRVSVYTGFSDGTYRGPDGSEFHCAACEDDVCVQHPRSDYMTGGDVHASGTRFVRELDGRLIWVNNPAHYYSTHPAHEAAA